jgi:hypothetical protein
MNRRQFFSLLLVRPQTTTTFRVAVLEAFETGTSTALLVHHDNPNTQAAFAAWLRAHPMASIRLRTNTGREFRGTIFRVRMCFGRGLILLNEQIQIRETEFLTVIA